MKLTNHPNAVPKDQLEWAEEVLAEEDVDEDEWRFALYVVESAMDYGVWDEQ